MERNHVVAACPRPKHGQRELQISWCWAPCLDLLPWSSWRIGCWRPHTVCMFLRTACCFPGPRRTSSVSCAFLPPQPANQDAIQPCGRAVTQSVHREKKVSPNSIHSKLKVWVGLNQSCAGLKLNTLWQHFPEHSPEKLAVHGLDSPEPHWVKNWLDGEAQRVAVTESNPVAARVLPAFQHQNCPLEVLSPSLVHQGSWGELNTNISIAGKDWEMNP